MTAIIEVSDVRKAFSNHPVLKGVDLTVTRGSIVGLIGANGSGKSTLLKVMLGLLRLDAGSSRLFGEESWSLSERSKARLGYVPQQVKLYPWMRVRQIVSYTGSFYQSWDESLVETLLDEWSLRRDAGVATLSGGELQKLGLILALGHRPELLLLDEPAAALDPVARREFLGRLLEPVSDEQTVLFSTHILSDLERVATHVAFLHDGRIALFDELDRLKDRVKRLRLTASDDLPLTFAIPGALRTEFKGRHARVALPDVDEQRIDALRQQWKAEISVEDLNLEDIYLELHDAAVA